MHKFFFRWMLCCNLKFLVSGFTHGKSLIGKKKKKKEKKKKENTQKIAHNEVGRDPNTQHTWKLGIIWLKRGSSGFQGFAALSPMKSPDVLPPGR